MEPAFKYGCYQFADDVFDFLDHATEGQLNELTNVAKRVLENKHYSDVSKFLDKYPITDHEEAAALYFLFGVLDHASLPFDSVNE
ncbi:MAG: hypothetical protein CMJ64_13880 [Planctomycetaceae bacterium]|nr:hypothetical protein [Planctomycetaceae bacterium]